MSLSHEILCCNADCGVSHPNFFYYDVVFLLFILSVQVVGSLRQKTLFENIHGYVFVYFF